MSAAELLRLARALGLLGAESYFLGISPAMALAMEPLGPAPGRWSGHDRSS